MIGRLFDGERPVAVLGDSGDWEPVNGDPLTRPIAAYLNAAHHPLKNRETGDHRLPFGVMALNRAAEALGLKVRLKRAIPPLPEGAVS